MNGVKTGKPFKVPELEAAPPPRVRVWSEEEEAVIRTYFSKRDVRSIYDYLKKKYPPGRSLDAIRKKGYGLKEE